VPQRALLTLRVGVAAFVVAIAIITWRVSWLSAEAAAVTLTVVAIAYAGAAGRLVRTTTVIPTTALLTPPS
jgi:hypothetical protein